MRDFSALSRPRLDRVALLLRLEDGSPWRLTMSPGIERFIGPYPRIEGLESSGPLLTFHPA